MTSKTSPALYSAPARRVSHASGMWLVAVAFLVSMAFSVVPTPLWTLYEVRDGFGTFAVTIAFGAYAVGVVVSLFLAGHISDSVGRRAVLLPAIGLQILAAAVFLLVPGFTALIIARLITGLGIGMLTATATAHILDLHAHAHPSADRTLGELVSAGANLGGFAVGGLASGLLAEFFPAPLLTPYIVFLALLVLAFVALLAVPETVDHKANRRPYRPQRIRVPREARGTYLSIAILAFAAFSVLGLFNSLAPIFISGTLGVSSRAVAGGVVFATFSAAALAQIIFRRLPVAAQVRLGVGLLVIGVVVLTISIQQGTSLLLFLIGGVIAGAGAGITFKAALGAGGALAEPQYRGEVLAGVFLAAYIGLALPVIGIGVATLSVPLSAAMLGFAGFTILLTVAAVMPLLRSFTKSLNH